MIRVSYDPTPGDVFRGTALLLRLKMFRRPQRIFGILLLSVWAFSHLHAQGWDRTSPAYLALPLVGIVMGFGDYVFAGIATLAARKMDSGKTLNFTFFEDRYTIEEPGAVATVNWTHILDVVIASDGFLIRPNVHVGIWVPLKSFADHAKGTQFIELLKSAGVSTRRP